MQIQKRGKEKIINSPPSLPKPVDETKQRRCYFYRQFFAGWVYQKSNLLMCTYELLIGDLIAGHIGIHKYDA